ncbi:Type 1 phosphatases regulator ypi1 [Ascosphaera aggregata]|nr:Type 1 phosphatases regulator ypi1 [Ascosphaera aggregata]
MSRNQTSVPAPRGTVSRVVETTGRIHDTSSHAAATLRLRGVPTPSSSEEITSGSSHTDVSSGPSVRWAPDVVDNEGLGKKQSKVCCIYVKPRAVDESSSSESDSSSSSDDDSGDSDRR